MVLLLDKMGFGIKMGFGTNSLFCKTGVPLNLMAMANDGVYILPRSFAEASHKQENIKLL